MFPLVLFHRPPQGILMRRPRFCQGQPTGGLARVVSGGAPDDNRCFGPWHDMHPKDPTMTRSTRREFLRRSALLGAAAWAAGPIGQSLAVAGEKAGSAMRFGLVTYQWGRDWDLRTLLANCASAKVFGVELRTTHAHKVEPNLTLAERRAVKARFADSPVTLVGLGSNECFHHPDPAALAKAIEATKAFLKLSHDVGSSGVKVKPNDLPKGVSRQKTIEQIGKSLNEVGKFAADYGQQVRLEVHGSCSRLPIMKEIMDVADHPSVAVCWNSNATDLEGEGLEYNFNLVKGRFGATAHVRPLNTPGYPWQELIGLFVKMDYRGWVLLEAGTDPPDRLKALAEQAEMFHEMVRRAQG